MKKELLNQLFRSTLLLLGLLVAVGTVDLKAQTACAIESTITNFSSTAPVAIPTGPGVVTSTINIAGAPAQIVEIQLQTFITHTFAADLDITLMSPAGTIVTLTTDNGAGNDNVFNGTLWDDDADPDGQVPYTTNPGLVAEHVYTNAVVATPLVPEEALAAFNGENPNGTWTLTVSDDLAGDGGSIDSWTIQLNAAATIPVVTVNNVANNVNLAIPTGPAVVSGTINVAGLNTYLRNLRVTTNLQHTFAADLDITLMSPAGTIVTLTTDNGAGNDNVFNGTVWDNDADPDGQVPYTTNPGLVQEHVYANLVTATPLVPEESLGAFFGENPNGTWTITISDDLAGDGGNLVSWNLELSTIPNQTCNFVLPIAPLSLSTSPTTCDITTTLNVPATTGLCTGVVYSIRVDNGPIVALPGTTATVTLTPGLHVITWYSTTP